MKRSIWYLSFASEIPLGLSQMICIVFFLLKSHIVCWPMETRGPCCGVISWLFVVGR